MQVSPPRLSLPMKEGGRDTAEAETAWGGFFFNDDLGIVLWVEEGQSICRALLPGLQAAPREGAEGALVTHPLPSEMMFQIAGHEKNDGPNCLLM